MDKHLYEKLFSTERMLKYFRRFPTNDEKAIALYHANISVSEAFYPVLAVFEVALRNSLNRELKDFFGTEDWYLHIENTTGLRNLKNEINTAKRHIANRNETITSSKVVAELTLGFWVRLLNAEYEKILWKPLRRAFPYANKKDRQRNKISAPINNIRAFRNRVFHHEPIVWNLEKLNEIHEEILMVLNWLNRDLDSILVKIDRVQDVLTKIKKEIYL